VRRREIIIDLETIAVTTSSEEKERKTLHLPGATNNTAPVPKVCFETTLQTNRRSSKKDVWGTGDKDPELRDSSLPVVKRRVWFKGITSG